MKYYSAAHENAALGKYTGEGRGTGIPASDILVNGEPASWDLTLVKGEPVVLHTTVSFPEEGDWQISVTFHDADKINGFTGTQDNIRFNVTVERGRWGWSEFHEGDRSGDPPPTPETIPPR